MVRRFLFVSHTVPPTGDWPLDDLAGTAGRVDVLCRAVQSTLFLSHGLRGETEVLLAFVKDPDHPTAIRLRGADVKGLHPDERSIAGVLRAALQSRPRDPWWDDVRPGVSVAPFDLETIAADPAATDRGATPVVLHKDGAPLEEAALPAAPLFILGDHEPLTRDEESVFPGAARVSLGPVWYHGNHVASVLQYTLDRRGAGP